MAASKCHKQTRTQDQMNLLLGPAWEILTFLFCKAPLDISFLAVLEPLLFLLFS